MDGNRLAHVTVWVEEHQRDHKTVLGELDLILAAIGRAQEREEWSSLLRLTRAVEGAVFAGRRWGTWESVLKTQLEAARSTGDRSSEAYSLHQLGTRAAALGDVFSALEFLSGALDLREKLGDLAGAAATRHNLSMVRPDGCPA